MYIYIHIYRYIYSYVYMYIHAHIHIYTCMYTYIYIWPYIFLYVNMHTCIFRYIYLCIYIDWENIRHFARWHHVVVPLPQKHTQLDLFTDRGELVFSDNNVFIFAHICTHIHRQTQAQTYKHRQTHTDRLFSTIRVFNIEPRGGYG